MSDEEIIQKLEGLKLKDVVIPISFIFRKDKISEIILRKIANELQLFLNGNGKYEDLDVFQTSWKTNKLIIDWLNNNGFSKIFE